MTFMEEMRKPYNVFTTCLAILGIAIGVLLYCISQEKRDPYYLVSDPLQVFDSSTSLPSIKVKDKQGNFISDSIYVTEISIWNAGERPIEPQDVRVPLSIKLTKALKIIDVLVVKQTQPRVLAFTAVQSIQEPSALNISFKHLDPGLGAKIKVVYTGGDDPGVVFRGSILGARFSNGASLVRKYVSSTTATFLSALMGAILAQLVDSLEKKLVPKNISPRRRRITKILMFFLMLLVLVTFLTVFFAAKVAPV